MSFGEASNLFGMERDESFKGIAAGIYQSFGSIDLYPSVQEKAANLLYLVVKDHSFTDDNKRIVAALFVYFLEKNATLRNSFGQQVKSSIAQRTPHWNRSLNLIMNTRREHAQTKQAEGGGTVCRITKTRG
jgi:prophage maintenance system killer protein